MYKIYEFDGTWFSSVLRKDKKLKSLQEVKQILENRKKRYENLYRNKPFEFQYFIVECETYKNKVIKSILNINDLENWKEY